jgi:hypothetical protein
MLFTPYRHKGLHMIRDSHLDQRELFSPDAFQTPFGAGLDPNNRWVRWAQEIPWPQLAASYHATLKAGGRPAKPARLVLGALIIKHRLGLSDTETLEQLRENPYLQYFCGLKRYQHERAFAPTLFVMLRKRLTAERFAAFEQAVIDRAEGAGRSASRPAPASCQASDSSLGEPGGANESNPDGEPEDEQPQEPAGNASARPTHRGELIVDASVAEQAIRYPTDVSLLNEARESGEALIDALWAKLGEHGLAEGGKPRTYRRRARAEYLRHSKEAPGERTRATRGAARATQLPQA